MTDPISTKIRHGATPTLAVYNKYRIASERRERNDASWKSASILVVCLVMLVFLALVLVKMVGDAFIAILICGLVAITVAPFVAARPAGRGRR